MSSPVNTVIWHQLIKQTPPHTLLSGTQTEKHGQRHTVLTPCRIMGQAHGGLKCTTAVIVEQNIMFPYYHTMEYGEPARLALGGLDWRTGPSNWPCVCPYACTCADCLPSRTCADEFVFVVSVHVQPNLKIKQQARWFLQRGLLPRQSLTQPIIPGEHIP